MKTTMLVILSVVLLIVVITLIIINQTSFGSYSSGSRLKRIHQSSNYRDGQFQNQSFTPTFAEDVSKFDMIRDGIFKINKRKSPSQKLPSVKTSFKTLDPKRDQLVWFGHSSYFMQIDGK